MLSVLAAASPAHAQLFGDPLLQSKVPAEYDRGHNTSVLDRPRPEYEAPGLPLGPFTVHPELHTELGYSTNVNGTNELRRSDAFVTLMPQAYGGTDALIDSLSVGFGAQFLRYAQASARNENGYFATVSGSDQIGRDLTVFGNADLRRYYEQSNSTGQPADAVEPVPITLARFNLRVERKIGRWAVSAVGESLSIDFTDVDASGGGQDRSGFSRPQRVLSCRTRQLRRDAGNLGLP